MSNLARPRYCLPRCILESSFQVLCRREKKIMENENNDPWLLSLVQGNNLSSYTHVKVPSVDKAIRKERKPQYPDKPQQAGLWTGVTFTENQPCEQVSYPERRDLKPGPHHRTSRLLSDRSDEYIRYTFLIFLFNFICWLGSPSGPKAQRHIVSKTMVNTADVKAKHFLWVESWI